MGFFASLLERTASAQEAAANLAAGDPVTVPVSSVSHPSAETWRAAQVATSIARSIPAVRRAEQAIAGTLSTFTLAAYQGGRRLPEDHPLTGWLRQPDPRRTREWLLRRTYQDAIWGDRCVWQILDRNLAGLPVKFARVHPDRIQTIEAPRDPDTVEAWIIDGDLLSTDEFRRKFLPFDFGGLGGLKRFGAPLLTLYADLQAAAGNYARAPHPKAVLLNESGASLEDDEVDALLAEWEQARNTSSVGYLEGMKYETHGWNARELQLTEAREHAALEVSRLFGLPAFAVDAATGDSTMTYANITDRRRDLVAALRPWSGVVDATLSLDDRSSRPRGLVLPYGVTVRTEAGDYLDDTPAVRMQTWATAKAAEILAVDEIRTLEPLVRSVQ